MYIGCVNSAVCIRWTGLGTGLGTGLWDWTHRKLRSSFLKARKQEIAERHYIAATVDNSLPSTRGVPTQLSPCRQPAVVLPCKTSSTSFRCEFVHDLTTTSRNTWRSLLANSRIPSVTTILQFLELFLCMLLPSLPGASVPARPIIIHCSCPQTISVWERADSVHRWRTRSDRKC